MKHLNQISQHVLQLFLAQSKERKLSLIAGIAIIASLTTYLIFWVMAPSYGILFSHLDNRDASQILTQLEQANISYQVRNQGGDILINKQLIDKTRIKLMGSDLQLTHSTGFELFDKTDFGMTDFSQKINYQRALQGELERTISSLDEVKQARVQLSIPESHLFQQDNNMARAAVTLHLHRALTPRQVNSIQQLITASVAHLQPSNVVIVDQNGNGLIASEDDSSTGHFSAKKKVEHYLNEKVMQMLHQIFTDEDVMVKIDATLNYDELQRERDKPQQNGLITHEKETRHSTPSKIGKTAIDQDVMHEKTYQLGHEKEQFTRANGTIERLTISVVLPEKTSKTKIMQVERLVKSVVGFNAMRGDMINVEALILEQKPVSPMRPETKPATLHLMNYVVGLLIILCIAWLIRQRVRIKQRRRLLTELSQWLIEHD